MNTHCILKGVVVYLLIAQGNVFARGNSTATKFTEPPISNNTDSITAQATFNLLSFIGTASSGQVTLAWKTDSQSHFTSFILERSGDESNFSTIGEVTVSAGAKTNSFTYVDGKPAAGRNFYRLKITDSSGNSTYSVVVPITYIPVNALQVHYDAQSGTIAVAGMETGLFYQLKVYNCNGQIMLQKTVTPTAASISINSLPHGLYVVYATDGVAAPVSQKVIW